MLETVEVDKAGLELDAAELEEALADEDRVMMLEELEELETVLDVEGEGNGVVVGSGKSEQ